ncbi:MAG: hypothetical protein EPO08_12985 [Rhodospirillaceae bacterium]|nr:MAG: hypothetical protein EPO08_12985 [Rhodospirillaceae bacterium]
MAGLSLGPIDTTNFLPPNLTLGNQPIGDQSGPGIGGDAPWTDKLINAAVGLGSAYGSLQLQNNEVNNAYKLAALSNGYYNQPGRAYTGPTPWLGITGTAPGGVVPGSGTAIGGINPVFVGMLAIIGVGAFLLLRRG